MTYESVLLSESSRSNDDPSSSPYIHKTTSYTQIDAMLDRMLYEVEKQEKLFALDLDVLDQSADHYVNTLELEPSTNALLEVPIKKTVKVPKVYQTVHNIEVGNSSVTEDLIVFDEDKKKTNEMEQNKNCDVNLDNQQEPTEKLSLESDESNVLLETSASNDNLNDYPYEFINFQKAVHASSESMSDVSVDNYPSSWEDINEEHYYEPIEPIPKLDQTVDSRNIWWEGTYRNLSSVPEEDEETVSLIGNYPTKSFLVNTRSRDKTVNQKSRDKRNSDSSSNGSSEEDELKKHQRTVKAEVKLLVKTTDRGREEIEIRSVREFLNGTTDNADTEPLMDNPLSSKNSKYPCLYNLKETSTRNTEKPVFTLQRLFIRPTDNKNLTETTTPETPPRTELIATSPERYPLQCEYEKLSNESDDESCSVDMKTKIDLYANRPFFPCYEQRKETNPFTQVTSNPFCDQSKVPKAYCDWLPISEDHLRGNVKIFRAQLIRMEFVVVSF